MTLHPITVVENVIEEYRRYLRTEFRARDPKLRQALEAELSSDRFLAQEPFFQAHRPFKSGKPWSALRLDPKLASVTEMRSTSETAYLHQSIAIDHLLGPDSGPLVVTTGTGSGKTEAFLLPVIQNAIEDSIAYKGRVGLTAILLYPMNALANDQEARIREYLEQSGHTHVRVARYDRSTKQDERAELRSRPPHILLTNYMMLEYLLVRPSDREALFANHRCRFFVLDEVHTYRGALGSNIALLVRRLREHLKRASHDWKAEDRADPRRFPELIPVATSATIKSVDEKDRTPEEVKRLRDEAVQEFVGSLTGVPKERFLVVGEELRALSIPTDASWPDEPVSVSVDPSDAESVRRGAAALAGLPDDTPLEASVPRAGILWFLADQLARRPRSVSATAELIRQEISARRDAPVAAIAEEVRTALVVGAALPEDFPGGLRLRAHRFIRGGWRFWRCVDASCGKLHAQGEAKCACGKQTAPLYLCRSCGAHALRFEGPEDPSEAPLAPTDGFTEQQEWLLYEHEGNPERVGEDEFITEDGRGRRRHGPKQMKGKRVFEGTFAPDSLEFASNGHAVECTLAPARNACVVCGSNAGSLPLLTPVRLGTSAAVRVVTEGLLEALADQHQAKGKQVKERALIFADSRQDAAHQARFITYAGRYDRMRRLVVQALEGGPRSIGDLVHDVMVRGLADNEALAGKKADAKYMSQADRERAQVWEEAPLLDDIAVRAGYRASLPNLGLVGIRYERLEEYVHDRGQEVASALGLSTAQLAYLCRCLLDAMRERWALSRPLLQYHPSNPTSPDYFRFADWDRRAAQPQGFTCKPLGDAMVPEAHIDADEIPAGISRNNLWRKPKQGGRPPRLQHRFQHLMRRLGGVGEATYGQLESVLELLMRGPEYVRPAKLHGYSKQDVTTLLQVNADIVHLELADAAIRRKCSVCNVKMPWAEVGAPCPRCHGVMEPWPALDVDENRYVQRILATDRLPLRAEEHTAQVPGDDRITIEERFKSDKDPLNVLACSPTLEMGIDIGGLDAVVMRNVPPRPDNYAQRGGRAGRRSRVGIVLGYARSTPHDQYFYDNPEEMIAGEVAAPGVGLGNRDVVLRHLNAIAFGAAEPGIAGRMVEYITTGGELNQEAVDALIAGFTAQREHAANLALSAWGPEILEPAQLNSEEKLIEALDRAPEKILDALQRVQLQIQELHKSVQGFADAGVGKWSAVAANDLRLRLLGIPSEDARRREEADDRGAGHPMRRLAEFGILPGYEFPSEPATLRLLRDKHEEMPLSVERRFGLAQYQPEAPAHARGKKWKVRGLDIASPWNPQVDEPQWRYVLCTACGLRFDQGEARCPRCRNSEHALKAHLPAHEFGGFLATEEDTPVLEEEDRFAMASRVRCQPQYNGRVAARHQLATGWTALVRANETIRWLNEGRAPNRAEKERGDPVLHDEARGFYLCPACGRLLKPEPPEKAGKGRKKAHKAGKADRYGHAPDCRLSGTAPVPLAIVAQNPATTVRIIRDFPLDVEEEDYFRWGYSLGYALRTGMRQLYMLDGGEIEFELEPLYDVSGDGGTSRRGTLTFIDPAVGGSGFLERAVSELDKIAQRARLHLDHDNCESACYRCLKSYRNQRHHEHLDWTLVIDDLEALSTAPPTPLPLTKADHADPKPWLEAYAAGVDSPLELAFKRKLESLGIELERQVPVSADPGGRIISRADFRVKGTDVLIYVDGMSHHVGDRLRRDRSIRRELRAGALAWNIVELQARHLNDATELTRLQHLVVKERDRVSSDLPPPPAAYPIAVVDALIDAQPNPVLRVKMRWDGIERALAYLAAAELSLLRERRGGFDAELLTILGELGKPVSMGTWYQYAVRLAALFEEDDTHPIAQAAHAMVTPAGKPSELALRVANDVVPLRNKFAHAMTASELAIVTSAEMLDERWIGIVRAMRPMNALQLVTPVAIIEPGEDGAPHRYRVRVHDGPTKPFPLRVIETRRKLDAPWAYLLDSDSGALPLKPFVACVDCESCGGAELRMARAIQLDAGAKVSMLAVDSMHEGKVEL